VTNTCGAEEILDSYGKYAAERNYEQHPFLEYFPCFLNSSTIIHAFLHIIYFKNKLSFSDAVFMILFSCMENIARRFGLQIHQEKTKYMIVERKQFKEE
jgi:hypothetical protein